MNIARADQSFMNATLNSPALATDLAARPCREARPLRAANPAQAAEPWALAMSGGGFRATFAALGAIRLLAGTGHLPDRKG